MCLIVDTVCLSKLMKTMKTVTAAGVLRSGLYFSKSLCLCFQATFSCSSDMMPC